MCYNLKWPFFKLRLCVRIFTFSRQCLGFETTLRLTKVEETFVYNTRGPTRKDQDFSVAETSLNRYNLRANAPKRRTHINSFLSERKKRRA